MQKKRSCEFAKYSASAPEEKKKGKQVRERKTKCFYISGQRVPKLSTEPRGKPQQRGEPGDDQSWQPVVIFGTITEPTRELVKFSTWDLYQHLSRLLNSWHQKVAHQVASYILFETRCKWDTPPKLSTTTMTHIQQQANEQLLLFLNIFIYFVKMNKKTREAQGKAREWTYSAAGQTQTCSVLHVFHLHHLGVDSASEHIERPVYRLGPLGGLLSRNPRKRYNAVVTGREKHPQIPAPQWDKDSVSVAYAYLF